MEGEAEDDAFGEDDMGYYEDGGKRTLTDEQIAIFRHSEIEAHLRERRYAQEAKDTQDSPATPSAVSVPDVEEGELEDDTANPETEVQRTSSTRGSNKNLKKKAGKMTTKQRKAQYAKEKGFFKQKIKPDLRKRTWDNVDDGMDSLMYDEGGSGDAVSGMASQRRRISYDDD